MQAADIIRMQMIRMKINFLMIISNDNDNKKMITSTGAARWCGG